MTRFPGNSVLVTGGSSGIGFAAAKAFVNEGARVVITGRDADALETARAALFGLIDANRNEDRDHEKSGTPPPAHSIQLPRKAGAMLRAGVAVNNGCR